jgi:DNA-directed RNA polymerase II subunit RPB2
MAQDAVKFLQTECWNILDSFLRDTRNYQSKHHIESYDLFIKQDLQRVLQSQNPITVFKDLLPPDASAAAAGAAGSRYKYEVRVYIGGRDGTAIQIGRPAVRHMETTRALFPNEARLRDLTYSAPVMVKIEVEVRIAGLEGISEQRKDWTVVTDASIPEGTFAATTVIENYPLMYIPVMLQSALCHLRNESPATIAEMGDDPYDHGGYFVIQGSDKVLVTRQVQAYNTLYVTGKFSDRCQVYANVTSMNPETKRRYMAAFMLMNTRERMGEFEVSLPMVRDPIPLFILFRALGIVTDEDIVRTILPDASSTETALLEPYLLPSLHAAYPILTRNLALSYMKTLTKGHSEEHVMDILLNQTFPHTPPNARAQYLGYVIRRMLRVHLELDPSTDRDDTRHQRLITSGQLIRDLFSLIYKDYTRAVRMNIDVRYNKNRTVYNNERFLDIFVQREQDMIFPPTQITDALMKSFRGNWGTTPQNKIEGVLQPLSRLTNLDTISHIRRAILEFDTSMKLKTPRRLHGSQYGYFCPIETPHGSHIGIVKSFAISATVSIGISPSPLIQWLLSGGNVLPLRETPRNVAIRAVPVYVNDGCIGYSMEAEALTNALRFLRRSGCINPYISIVFARKERELHIHTDEGRPCRPLLYVIHGALAPMLQNYAKLQSKYDGRIPWRVFMVGERETALRRSWADGGVDVSAVPLGTPLADIPGKLLGHIGCCEFIDSYEQNESMLSSFGHDLEHATHVELHPSTQAGLLGSLTPYAGHNAYARNQYSCIQARQGLGTYALNFDNRFDSSGHVTCNNELPLCRTFYSTYYGGARMGYGQNAIVAIMSYTGYNQDDGLMVNRTSVQRGQFWSMYFKTYKTWEETDVAHNIVTRLGNPIKDDTWTDVRAGFDYNSLDDDGIIKVGSVVSDSTVLVGRYVRTGTGEVRDVSLVPAKWTMGVVDKVVVTTNNEGLRSVKVRIHEMRIPQLGDKFSSRAGQKGTIGMLWRQEDMPRTAGGIVPDVIINPQAFPGRMSLGQLLESVIGKTALMCGARANATMFTTNAKTLHFGQLLEDFGYQRWGDEICYNGMTGEQMQTEIFIGPTYYMRLKHMPRDKLNARGAGRKDMRTHQPTEGRANQGGLRIGEMERDSLIAHGVSAFLQESMMKRSDGTTFMICNGCGSVPIYNPRENMHMCIRCNGPAEFAGTTVSDARLVPGWRQKRSSFSEVEMPYSANSLLQEVETFMNISVRVLTEGSLRRMRDEDVWAFTTANSANSRSARTSLSLTDTATDTTSASEKDDAEGLDTIPLDTIPESAESEGPNSAVVSEPATGPTGSTDSGSSGSGSTTTGPTASGSTGSTASGSTGSTTTGPTDTGPTASGPTASGTTNSSSTASGSTASGTTDSGPTASGPTDSSSSDSSAATTGGGAVKDDQVTLDDIVRAARMSIAHDAPLQQQQQQQEAVDATSNGATAGGVRVIHINTESVEPRNEGADTDN